MLLQVIEENLSTKRLDYAKLIILQCSELIEQYSCTESNFRNETFFQVGVEQTFPAMPRDPIRNVQFSKSQNMWVFLETLHNYPACTRRTIAEHIFNLIAEINPEVLLIMWNCCFEQRLPG